MSMTAEMTSKIQVKVINIFNAHYNIANNHRTSNKKIKKVQNNEPHPYDKPLDPVEEAKRRELMAQQYEKKFEADKNRGVSKEGQIEAKLREAKLKRVEEYEKQHPNEPRQFRVSR